LIQFLAFIVAKTENTEISCWRHIFRTQWFYFKWVPREDDLRQGNACSLCKEI